MMAKSFAFLVAIAEAATCTGTQDLVVSEPQCYHGFGYEHVTDSEHFAEDVNMKIADFRANGAGHMDMEVWSDRVGDGFKGAFTCSNKVFTKSGLKITTDLSDCLIGITIPEIDFCSDQDAVKVTVKADAVVTINATLSRVVCSALKFCSGTNDPVVTAPQCYTGFLVPEIRLEGVDVKIDDFSNGAGHMEIERWGRGGVEFTCSNKVFTKSGVKITTDLSDCHGTTIQEIDFCSDQDAVMVTFNRGDSPVTANLSRVACSGRAQRHLALSQVLTSRPLKQYAALGNSFTADDSVFGVVEEEPDMALV